MGSTVEEKLQLPIIDFSTLDPNNHNTQQWQATIAKVSQALETHGCFEAIYDKISTQLRDELFGQAIKEFFDLPIEVKMRNFSTEGKLMGYIGQLPGMVYESLRIDAAATIEGVERFSGLLWPEGIPSFEYGVPLDPETKVAMAAHKDPNMLTIVCQHQAEGLEVQTERWGVDSCCSSPKLFHRLDWGIIYLKSKKKKKEKMLRKKTGEFDESPPDFDHSNPYGDPVAMLDYREHLVREKWIQIETAKIIREKLKRCYRIEGVNHQQKCRHLVDQYLESTCGVGWGKDHRPYEFHGPKKEVE